MASKKGGAPKCEVIFDRCWLLFARPPDPQFCITQRNNAFAVGQKLDSVDSIRMTRETGQLLAAFRLSKSQRPVGATHGQPPAVRRKGDSARGLGEGVQVA